MFLTCKPFDQFTSQPIIQHSIPCTQRLAGCLTVFFHWRNPSCIHAGFYLSRYTDSTGPSVLASTQFEAIAARKAFPCFDEPRFKATYNITLITPPAPVLALSNMPEASQSSVPNGMTMHTYQVRRWVAECSRIRICIS